MTRVNTAIEKLAPYTKTNIDAIQGAKSPRTYELKIESRDAYYFNGVKYNLWQDNRIIYLVANLPLAVNYTKVISETSMIDMVNNGDLGAFLLFANGRFIKWSNITIVCDYKYNYIIIDNIVEENPDIRCILIPDIPTYEEFAKYATNPAFIFDDGGKAVFAIGAETYTTIGIKNAYSESFGIVPNTRVKVSVDVDFKIASDNIVLFKNGLLNTTAKIIIYPYNILEIIDDDYVDGDYYFYHLFCYKNSNKSKSNMYSIKDNSSLITSILNGDDTEFITKLAESFDFKLNKRQSYEQNMAKALSYIMGYNGSLLDTIYDDINNIVSIEYSGADIIKLKKTDGLVTMSRRVRGDISSYVIIYKNGELYDRYNTLYYDNKDFSFIADTITSTDIIEIQYYTNIDNRSYQVRVSDEYSIVVDPSVNMDTMKLFTMNPVVHSYNLPRYYETQYTIPYSYTKSDDDIVTIVPEDSLYNNTRLYIASNRRFNYYRVTATEDIFKVALPEEFIFDTDPTHYMIFINNKRVDLSTVKITTALETRPFDSLYLYTSLPLAIGDIIDIFYTPEAMKEISCKSTGGKYNFIYIDKSQLPYSLDSNKFMYFVNGVKLSAKDIIPVSNSMVRLNFNSTELINMTVVHYIDEESILKAVFTDNLSSRVDDLTISELILLFPNSEVLKTLGPNIYDKALDIKALIYEVIKDYWMRPSIYTGDPFVYDYDVEYFQNVYNSHEDLYNIELADSNDEDKIQPNG